MHKWEIIIYWSAEDGVFVAQVPELPGCAAHGDAPEAALANCGDAINRWLGTANGFGREIPTPKGRRLRFA